jgi:tRNA (cytidine/uridine-2'-O-)-methyltransferase
LFDVVLYQPEIPPNTGNIMRLCANTGARLHLVEPLGFELEDRLLRRAGLDYREWATVRVHKNLDAYLTDCAPPRVYAFTTRGTRLFTAPAFAAADALLFGPETRGLPSPVLERVPPRRRLFIPMQAGNRSLNLSNAVAVALFEAWRQHRFRGAEQR